jgi:hypothetical protein
MYITRRLLDADHYFELGTTTLYFRITLASSNISLAIFWMLITISSWERTICYFKITFASSLAVCWMLITISTWERPI